LRQNRLNIVSDYSRQRDKTLRSIKTHSGDLRVSRKKANIGERPQLCGRLFTPM
jgi:hypothetical protein